MLAARRFIHKTISAMTAASVYDFKMKDADGKEVGLDKYKGKVLIIVNVASQCGLTNSNYTQFKELLDKYKSEGLEIAAFPCNQFGNQEPSCEIDIKSFVNDKFKFEPDLFSKIDVNGDKADPLYKFLKSQKGGTLIDAIKWNFTKFLVDRDGNVIKRFGPTTEPKDMLKDIEAALKSPAKIGSKFALIETSSGEDVRMESVIEQEMRKLNSGSNCMPLRFWLELVNCMLAKKCISNPRKVSEFVVDSLQELLSQGRPPIVLGNLVELLSHVLPEREISDWAEVTDWAVETLNTPSSSLFLLKGVVNYLKKMAANGDSSHVSRVVDICCQRMTQVTPPPMAYVNLLTEFLKDYAVGGFFNLETSQKVVNSIQRYKRKINDSMLEILVETIRKYPAIELNFWPENWENESNRIESFVLFFASDLLSDQEAPYVAEVVSSKFMTALFFSSLISKLDEKALEKYLDVILNNTPSIKESDYGYELLVSELDKRSLPFAAHFLRKSPRKLWKNKNILKNLKTRHGEEVLEQFDMNDLKLKIADFVSKCLESSEWEEKDTGLEIGSIFSCFLPSRETLLEFVKDNQSPYVQQTAMKTLRDHFGGVPIEAAKEILLTSSEPTAREEAMKSLAECDALEEDDVIEILSTCLEEDNHFLKFKAVEVAERLLNGKFRNSEHLKALLLEKTNDAEVGNVVRGILGMSSLEVVQMETPLQIITQMVDSLTLRRPADDTMDCY
ncbi:unnamed protein product [Caenorhabditis auriculariae]|uniref:Glutathione peroxidase n=1 Tax=Caenorhabditis auriculariae TaxID=2777116 RepID=A0A8S1HE18_9PELO|nr:unnamed protein product [Caenorhabditis auriculariae]